MNVPTVLLRTAQEVAEMLNVKRSTIYEWVRMDYIPAIRLGTGPKKPCVRFDQEEVLRWLHEKKTEGRLTRVPVCN